MSVIRAAWKNQIGPWVAAGYRVVVPDMLGYGQTDKPDEPEEYSPKKLSDDLAALLDHISSPKAVCISCRPMAYLNPRHMISRRLSLVTTGVRLLPRGLFSGTLSGRLVSPSECRLGWTLSRQT